MTLNLIPQTINHTDFTPRITVIGVGGGGTNAVNNMMGDFTDLDRELDVKVRVMNAAIDSQIDANVDSDEAAEYLGNLFKRQGLYNALKRAGAREGATVEIGAFRFEYFDDEEQR